VIYADSRVQKAPNKMPDQSQTSKDERPNNSPSEKTQPTNAETKAPGKTAAAGKANGNDPAPYDWVTRRSACTLPKIFATLRAEVEKDVATRNSLRLNSAPYEFSMTDDINAFTVLLKANELQRSVIFTLADHAIVVCGGHPNDQATQMFEVTLAFDDAGKCRLHVDAQEREFWQVRRMALEELMFRGL
jgi:hypothetical protein